VAPVVLMIEIETEVVVEVIEVVLVVLDRKIPQIQ
jgi:hypothetical protein